VPVGNVAQTYKFRTTGLGHVQKTGFNRFQVTFIHGQNIYVIAVGRVHRICEMYQFLALYFPLDRINSCMQKSQARKYAQ
jgi:hypothetical protein